MYIFIYKYIAYVREYSLAKTHTLLLKFPGKEKIFQKKKNFIKAVSWLIQFVETGA